VVERGAFTVVDNHSVSLSHVRAGGVILDVGCRGFRFAEFFGRKAHQLVCLDPAPDEVLPVSMNACWYRFIRSALVGPSHPRTGWLRMTADPEARNVAPSRDSESDVQIPCITLDELASQTGIASYELVKLNCEGAEFDILDGLTGASWARQIVVSFHEHTPQARGDAAIEALIGKLSAWYEVFNHVKEPRYGCVANYWDTVLIRREG
jgi:FkbM family methyltransferase